MATCTVTIRSPQCSPRRLWLRDCQATLSNAFRRASSAALPSTVFRVIVRFCHPIDARTIRRANKELSYVVANTDLVWGEARWRWNRRKEECWRWAVKSGHVEVVKWCLESGGLDVHIRNDWALRRAARDGYLELVKLLLEKGADPHAEYEEALSGAAASAHLEVVRLLLEKESNIMAVHEALMAAAPLGHRHIVRLLWEKGAKLDPATLGWRLEWIRSMLENGLLDFDPTVAL
ncbi:hypothetical protein HK104_011223 [Borealophlyctis nickersoniae]|nr:hypothetical protein HK104_011223 [Borealophlyctis nickersoniae]